MRNNRNPGSLRADLRRFTRQRIIDAALKAFAADGFRATSVERITELAGTTPPTFYRYFASKNDLMVPLEEYLTRENLKALTLLNAIENIDFESIRKWVDQYAISWTRLRKLCAAYWEAADIDPDVSKSTFAISLDMTEALGNLIERIDAPREQAVRWRIAVVIPMLDRAMQTVLSIEDDELRDGVMDELAHMLLMAFAVHGETIAPGER